MSQTNTTSSNAPVQAAPSAFFGAEYISFYIIQVKMFENKIANCALEINRLQCLCNIVYCFLIFFFGFVNFLRKNFVDIIFDKK